MTRWIIKFYPSAGERYSPSDFIHQISKKEDIALINQKLVTISQLEAYKWPRKWVKLIAKDIYQLRAGDYRIYFGIDQNNFLIVCHICRKVSQKANPGDISRAHDNFADYIKLKKGKQ